MYETEKDCASIDVLAAAINHQAAELAALADERIRSARSRKTMAESSLFRPDNEDQAEREMRVTDLQDELNAATVIAGEASKIREASATIQKLARGRVPVGI